MAEPGIITVYVADDHPLFLDALTRIVNAEPDFQLVGSSGDGDAALTTILDLAPAIAIVDHQLPSRSGTEILRSLAASGCPTRVIILSADQAGSLVYDAVQLGAAGFVTKSSTFAAIRDAIRAVAGGSSVIGPELQAGLLDEIRGHAQPSPPSLTPRELQILQLIAAGLSAPEIGSRLFISPSTVKTHVKSVFEKLEVNDRAAAVAAGMRRGLLV